MTLDELVRGISSFNGSTHTSRLLLFGWYLHTVKDQARFNVGNLRACYSELTMEEPSNVSQLLSGLLKQKPRKLLHDRRGYYLERTTREQFDGQHGQRPATVLVHKLLRELPVKLANTAERVYLEEAILCFRSCAFRAAVVMTWNVAYDHLCQHVLHNRLADFNTTLKAKFPKVHPIAARADFNELKERHVLDICRTASIISASMNKLLTEKLDKRNMAAHPSGVTFSQLQAEEYIADLVTNAVLKL